MKNKMFFIFGFIILFFVFIFCFSSDSSAFVVNDGDLKIDYGAIEDDMYDYFFIVKKSSNSGFVYYLYTFPDSDGNHLRQVKTNTYYVICDDSCIYYSYYTNPSSSQHVYRFETRNTAFASEITLNDIILSNFDIICRDIKEPVYKANFSSFLNPYIMNKEEISSGKFDKVVINSGDYDKDTLKDFYLLSYYYSEHTEPDITDLYPQKEILLDNTSEYCVGFNDKWGYIFEVPLSVLDIDLKEGNKYGIRLAFKDNWVEEYQMYAYRYIEQIDFDIGVVTPEDKEQADRDKQIELQKEQNETSKGIWDTLKQLLDFFNPFSENFFVYKLISLLVEAFKSLFIPSEDFFENWFQDLNDYFSDTLGILYYPLDLLIDFLTRVQDIPETNTAIISFPGFTLNFMGYSAELIPAFEYDFNSILVNDTLKTIHSIYLVFTDIILWLGVVILGSNCLRTIFGGMSGEVVDNLFSSERSYQKYSNYRKNKSRYNKEHGKSE